MHFLLNGIVFNKSFSCIQPFFLHFPLDKDMQECYYAPVGGHTARRGFPIGSRGSAAYNKD